MATLKEYTDEALPQKEQSNGSDNCFRKLNGDDGYELNLSARILSKSKYSGE
jgi:hypothetical protein